MKNVICLIILCWLGVNAQAQTATPSNGQLSLSRQEVINKKVPPGSQAPGSSGTSKVIVLYGDPTLPGLYTILLEVEPHTTIAAHHHPDNRVGTVISGTWHFGYGQVFDGSKLKTLPPGSIYSECPGCDHFAQTGDTKVVVEITGYGPTGATYVNPADDPSKKGGK
jgi:quercetin dioxygenase-like cupin family protein